MGGIDAADGVVQPGTKGDSLAERDVTTNVRLAGLKKGAKQRSDRNDFSPALPLDRHHGSRHRLECGEPFGRRSVLMRRSPADIYEMADSL